MRTYTKNTEETLITFHTGRGGRYYNSGHTTHRDQDQDINTYTESLFTAFDNESEIRDILGDRENLLDLLNDASCGSIEAQERFEKLTNLKLGELIYVDHNGNEVGLKVDNDGTGVIDLDGEYDTTVVIRLKDCSTREFKLILESNNYVSDDVKQYCQEKLVEENILQP